VYPFRIFFLFMLTNACFVSMQDYEVESDRFNVIGIFISGNYAQNGIRNCIITHL
jgi:hypothetical protein